MGWNKAYITLGFIRQIALFAKMDSHQDPKPGKTYISPRLDSSGEPKRKVRIATTLIEQPETYAFAQIKDEVVLRHKEDAKTCIIAKFFEDDRGVFVLNIKATQLQLAVSRYFHVL